MICLLPFLFLFLLLASGSHLLRGEGIILGLCFLFFVGIAIWGERGLFFFFSSFLFFIFCSFYVQLEWHGIGNKYAMLRDLGIWGFGDLG